LICKINPRINRSWLVGNYSSFQKIASTEWISFFPLPEISPKYLMYFMRQHSFRDYLSSHASGVGGSLMRSNAKTVGDYLFRIAPRSEQNRIVEEIERRFSLLDEGTANLRRVQSNLKRYRASLLRAACSGKLVPTEAELAKAEGRTFEPASELLKRILVERRERWEADELAKMRARRKEPADGRWKAKYIEPITIDTSALPGLPNGWTWTSLGQLSVTIRNGSSIVPNSDDGVPMLRTNAVRPLSVDLSEIRFAAAQHEKLLRPYFVRENDLLFTRYNGNPDLVGVCGRVKVVFDNIAHPDKLIKVQIVKGFVSPAYVELVCNCGESRRFLQSKVRTTAGQAGVSGADLKSTPIPLPPLAEQARIGFEIDRLTSLAQESEALVNASAKRAARLRQSILRDAFTGKLVPQDPSDEHASILLAKIKLERQSKSIGRKEKRNGILNGVDAARKTVSSRDAGRLVDIKEGGL
jgi:type I restriction enzyme S subunit